MKKLYFITAICTLLTASSFAQKTPTKNDPEAKKILDAVSAKFKTFTSVKAAFSYKVENASGKTLSSKNGSILMKGTKYRLSFSGQEIFCNGTTVWNYDKGANEVTINNVDPNGNTITPQKLFSNFYDKDFYYSLNGEKKIGTKTIQEIQMTPVDKSKSFHTVYLQIDKASQTIYSTKVLENAGNRYSYTVTSMKTNIPAADNQFVFDKSKYPGVTVEDLR
ncbi:MAG: outer membrane lipoprotein carrier protein LolA [Sphingobacteriales bacterium]|nr:outer membrane lipoprotein carrier protein LolA [Sphingobacteriales bacterium]